MGNNTPRTNAVCNEIADLANTLRDAGCSSLSLQQFQIIIQKQLEKLRDHARQLETELTTAASYRQKIVQDVGTDDICIMLAWQRIAVRLGTLWNQYIKLAREHGDIGFIREQETVAELRILCATLPPKTKETLREQIAEIKQKHEGEQLLEVMIDAVNRSNGRDPAMQIILNELARRSQPPTTTGEHDICANCKHWTAYRHENDLPIRGNCFVSDKRLVTDSDATCQDFVKMTEPQQK